MVCNWKYQGGERTTRATQLQRGFTSQQSVFHKAKKDADTAVETNYVVSELIAKAGKPVTEGQFLKDCMFESLFDNITLLVNTVVERISKLSSDLYDQLCEKVKAFTAYWRLMNTQMKPTMFSSQFSSRLLMRSAK